MSSEPVTPVAPATTCPCGSPALYAACCERYLRGPEHLLAPTAEALMRSRYSAYVARDAAYLLATWHASSRPGRLDFPAGLRWLGLTVVRHEQSDADHAVVEFVAHSEVRRPGLRQPQPDTHAQIMHEVSRFVREANHWFYLDGAVS